MYRGPWGGEETRLSGATVRVRGRRGNGGEERRKRRETERCGMRRLK